jgi:hypothetical protein
MRSKNGKTNELGFKELAAIHPIKCLYGGTQKTKLPLLNNWGYKPLNGKFGSLQIFFIGRMPSDRNLLILDASLAIPTRALRFQASRRLRTRRSDRPPGRLDRPGGQTTPPGRLDQPGWPHLLIESSASVLWLNRVTQWFSDEPLQTPQTRCSLRQSPLMTRLPRSPGSTLVLRLNQETVHDFVSLFLPPCVPHLTPLATGSLEPSLLVFSTRGGLTGDDLSHLFFTCTNTSQATTCTCNT